jgi:hypothetical protein
VCVAICGTLGWDPTDWLDSPVEAAGARTRAVNNSSHPTTSDFRGRLYPTKPPRQIVLQNVIAASSERAKFQLSICCPITNHRS